VGVAVGAGVAVRVGAGVAVLVLVGVGEGRAVAVEVGAGVAVSAGVEVALGRGVAVQVGVGVRVGARVLVGVGVSGGVVAVSVGIAGIGVSVGLAVGAGVDVAPAVAVPTRAGTVVTGVAAVPTATARPGMRPNPWRSSGMVISSSAMPATKMRAITASPAHGRRRGAPQVTHSSRLRLFTVPQVRQRTRRGRRRVWPQREQTSCSAGISAPQCLHTRTRSLLLIVPTIQAPGPLPLDSRFRGNDRRWPLAAKAENRVHGTTDRAFRQTALPPVPGRR
jgi:hypothetical protein